MKKLILIFGVLVLLAAVGVYFLLPTNINWEKYVQEASSEIATRTGLALKIHGTPVFSMKPAPALVLNQVRLGNVKEATYPEMMTAVRAELLFDTASLFRRKIKVKKITLFAPQFYFETMTDGKWNWQIAFFDKAGTNSAIGFDSLLLNDGKAEIKRDKYTPPRKWDRINAEMFADSMQGPFFFEGNFAALSSSFGFSLKVEKYLNGQSPDFSLRLINAPAEASFVFNGKYGLSDTDRGMLAGNLNFEIRKPEQFFALMYPQEKLPPAVFQPLVGNLKLNKIAQTGTTELTDVLFRYGASSATGKLSIRSLSSQEASVLQAQTEAQGDDNDEEEIILRDPNRPSETIRLEDTPIKETKLAQNLLPKVVNGEFVFSKLDADPFLENLPAIINFVAKRDYFAKTQDSYTLKLMLDTVNYKKDVVHQLSSQIKSVPQGLFFDDLSATLPSNAYVSGKATLALTQNPLLSGKISIEASNFKAILDWLGVPLPDEIPQNLLRSVKAETDFKLASNGIVMQQMKGNLDKINFFGNFALRQGVRKAVNIAADISELDFAQYFPISSKEFIQKREEFARKDMKDKLKSLSERLAFFGNFDLNFKLKADTLSWGGIKAENIKSDFSVVRGQMKIDELSANKLFASSISVQGVAEGFGTDPKFNDFQVRINAEQLSSLTQALGISLPRGIAPQDKMQLSSRFSGSMQIMDFDISADFGTTRFMGKGGFKETSSSALDWDIDVDVYHENFRNFVRFFSDAYRPILANPGVLNLKGHVFKSKDLFHLMNMDARIGESEFKGFFKLREQGEIPIVEAEINGGDLALLGMLPNTNFAESLSISSLKTVPKDAWEKNGILTLLTENLSFSKKPFDFSFLGKYEASVVLKANNLFFNTFVLSDFDGIIKLSEEKVVIDVRKALWNKANFGGIFNLMPVGDTLSMRSAVRLSNINIPAALFVSDVLNISAVKDMTLNLNVSSKGGSTSSLMASLAGKGALSFEKADLDRFNLEKFRQVVSQQPQMSAEEIQSAVLQGQTELNRLTADIGIKDGKFTLQPASFVYDDQQNTSSSFVYDYLKNVLSATISFPMGASVPDISLSVEKKENQPAALSQNIPEVVQALVKLEGQQKEQAMKQAKALRQKENEKQEKIFQKSFERLERIDEQLTLASANLVKKIEVIRPIAEKVYQVQRYLIILNNAEKTLTALNKELQKTKAKANNERRIADETIDTLEQKIKQDYFDKESEIEANYNTAQIIGAKGTVFDALKQANEILRSDVKAQSSHADLTNISENTDKIKTLIKNIKDIYEKSDVKDIGLEDLTVLAGQAEAELDKIQSLHRKTQDAIAQKNAKMAAEEKAKLEAEEKKKKEEEEQRKAAEAAAAAEKARQEAELRERQRTIVRKDGVQSISAPAAKTQSAASLQPTAVLEQEKENENQTEVKKENSIIIRRR